MSKAVLRIMFASVVAGTLVESAPAAAQAPAGSGVVAETPSHVPPALTATDLAAFLDGVVPLALQSQDIAGAVIAVVKDGRLLLARGYGYSDLARKVPVDPDATLFRVASISKLVTATAVMQLVEQGVLTLDQDVGAYLDFELPRRFPEAITLTHLLTHTAGFEEAVKQLPADSGQAAPLREWVALTTPPQLYRPGTVTSYSNYGSDLAGYIVERMSGMPFHEYVRTRILEPLGMHSSSIAQPLPKALGERVSREYPAASDSAGEYEVFPGEPSGNLAATATDMARFAIAHLALGALPDSGRLLSEATARRMGATAFRTHPAVPGMALGFFEEDRHGRRILGHGGDLSRFHSHLSLLMDEDVAFFVSVNSSGSGPAFYGLREAVRDAFLDRYFPRAAALEPVAADARGRSRAVAGGYTLSRRSESSLARLMGLFFDVGITANPDGSIRVGVLAGPNGAPLRWWPVGESVFRTEDGSQVIGVVAGDGTLPDRIAFLGGHELHRVGLADDRTFTLRLLAAIAIGLGLPLLLWPVAALVRRRYGALWRDDGAGRRLRAATRVCALAALASLVGLGLFLMQGLAGGIDLDSRSDWMVVVIRLLALVGAAGAVAGLMALVRSVRRGGNGWATLKYLTASIATLVFVWFAVHWNLLSWNFRY